MVVLVREIREVREGDGMGSRGTGFRVGGTVS